MISAFKFYFFSHNKKIYRTIAHEFDTSVRHVYKLAHGKRTKNNLDYYIVKKTKGGRSCFFHLLLVTPVIGV